MQISVDINLPLAQFDLQITQSLNLSGIHGIFGHSGSGKSTFLRTIAGFEKDADAIITLNNRLLQHPKNKTFIAAENRNVAYIFQRSTLLPHLSVLDNLRFAEKRRCKHTIELDDLIDAMKIAPLLNQPIEKLSGGEEQIIALARAIIFEPDLLLLDEPLSALDYANKRKLIELISHVHRTYDIPMLYVTHSMDELQQIATHITVLEQGKVIHTGKTHHVIHKLNHSELIQQQTSLTLLDVEQAKIKDEFGLVPVSFDKNRTNSQTLYMSSKNYAHVNKSTSNTFRCFVLASDVSICTKPADHSSIVNQLQGTISTIEVNKHQVLVTVDVVTDTETQPFYASISAYSLDKLALTLNEQVFIQFKASAIRTAFD